MCNDEKILQDMSYKVINDYVEARKKHVTIDLSRQFHQLLKNYIIWQNMKDLKKTSHIGNNVLTMH